MTWEKTSTQMLGALDPLSIQVDERTLIDHLSFAASFTELINFYDKTNHKNGSWRSFFLKDPTILLAAISKTDYSSKHMLFILLSKKLDNMPAEDWTVGRLSQQASPCRLLLGQLFDLIQSIFVEINDWLSLMENDAKTYQLKDFVKKNVGDKQAVLLWQFLTLKRCASQSCRDISAPDYRLFEEFHPIWRTSINNTPTQLPEDSNLLRLTQQLYHSIFSFYMQVIDSAKSAFDERNGKIDSPPDTALFIAFVRLLSVQQRQLNRITQRHLDFYYRDILKQNNKPAQADEVFICLTLDKNTQAFHLPAGTEFDAGLDAQKQPLKFVSTQAQSLNQITLKQVKTLRYCENPGAGSAMSLRLNVIDKPSAIKKDPLGQLQSWPLFGDDQGTVIKQGFAFASPVLSLQGGNRKLIVNFEFSDPIKGNYFDNCDIYLSTEKDWFKTSFKARPIAENQLQLTIELNMNDPAITRFIENPEGIDTQWPLFKMVLSDTVYLSEPPRLNKITLANAVNQFSFFELYNNNGKLAENINFLPFGPIVSKGDNFYIGSREIFSKPITKLDLQIDWDQLPQYMEDYYQAYNEFLNKSYLNSQETQPQKLEFQVNSLCDFIASDSLTLGQRYLLCRTLNKILKISLNTDNVGKSNDKLAKAITSAYPNSADPFKSFLESIDKKLKNQNPLKNYRSPALFNNYCFKVDFCLWRQNQWLKIPAENIAAPAFAQTQNDQTALMNRGDDAYQVSLFNTQAPEPAAITQHTAHTKTLSRLRYGLQSLTFKKSKSAPTAQTPRQPPLASNSLFQFNSLAFEKISPEPALLLRALDFSAPKKTGFLNMKLQNPTYGFGNSLYAQAVTYVSQKNAYLLLNKNNKQPESIPLPNPPYAPKISKISASYSANHPFDFQSDRDKYPFEFYHYDIFGCYPVYDNNRSDNKPVIHPMQSPGFVAQPESINAPIKLFSGIGASACLYLNLENVQPPCQLSLYFELNQLIGALESDQAPGYYYLTDDGWQTLKILADGTHQLSCSGIIEISIPQDISQNNPLMPGCWLAVTGNSSTADLTQVAFLNTQAIKAKRLIQPNHTGSQTPRLSAGQIKAMVMPLPQIDALNQPFASFKGLAEENDTAFYLRVSQRIKTKDRVSHQADFQTMAFKALPRLFFCKYIAKPNKKLRLGLVNGYESALQPEAYRPVVNRCDIDAIRRYFTDRTSPFVQIELFNLSHESVTIEAKLKFTATAPANRLCEEISRQLKIYLSPWIQSEQPQITIDEGLSSAAIIDYLSRLPEVTSVCSLKLTTELQKQVSDNFIIFPKQADGLFVSAQTHEISAAAA